MCITCVVGCIIYLRMYAVRQRNKERKNAAHFVMWFCVCVLNNRSSCWLFDFISLFRLNKEKKAHDLQSEQEINISYRQIQRTQTLVHSFIHAMPYHTWTNNCTLCNKQRRKRTFMRIKITKLPSICRYYYIAFLHKCYKNFLKLFTVRRALHVHSCTCAHPMKMRHFITIRMYAEITIQHVCGQINVYNMSMHSQYTPSPIAQALSRLILLLSINSMRVRTTESTLILIKCT